MDFIVGKMFLLKWMGVFLIFVIDLCLKWRYPSSVQIFIMISLSIKDYFDNSVWEDAHVFVGCVCVFALQVCSMYSTAETPQSDSHPAMEL